MALKGTATIELTNEDGSKEIIKHDNMITNAVNDLCFSQRGEMASILKIVNNNDSYAQAMFGGLLLFGENLNDDANDYFIPSTNIVGYASQDAYAGLDVARGSFNASEGGVQEDGSYKFVWDFATSQANGVIKALALCPNMMGQIGASDTIQDSESKDFYVANDLTAPFNTYGRMLPDDGTTNGVSNHNLHIVAVVGDVAYAIDEYNIYLDSRLTNRHILNNGGILKLHKFKLGASSISLADRVCMARYLGCDDVALPTEFTSILFTGNDHHCLTYFFDYATSKLTLFPCYKKSDIAINGTTKYVDVDLKNNMNVTTYTFTNNTAGYIYYDGGTHNYNQKYTMFICKDYIVNFSVVDSETKMYVTKRSDNTQVAPVKYGNGNDFKFSTTNVILFHPVYVHNNIFIFRYAVGYNYCYYILDMSTGIIKKTNARNMSVDNMVDIGSKVVFARCMSYASYRLMVNPFILTTKNNLDSPVTKTASQTMKITYTLSEVTESEGV